MMDSALVRLKKNLKLCPVFVDHYMALPLPMGEGWGEGYLIGDV